MVYYQLSNRVYSAIDFTIIQIYIECYKVSWIYAIISGGFCVNIVLDSFQ